MNTDTDKSDGNLQGAFGDRGTNVNAIAYGHPHAEKIIGEVKQLLLESSTGTDLIHFLNKHQIPIQIMKGNGEGGFSPDMMSIIIQTSGKTSEMNADIFINIVKGLREAAQEIGGFETPDPSKDVIKYAEFIHARNLESITYVCKIIKELTNSSYFSVLLDSLTKFGLYNMYKAYLNGASKEELFTEYAEAYNTINRGSY